MEPVVLATWGLVVVTGLLVAVSFVQYRSIRKQADDERTASRERAGREQEQIGALTAQVSALAASARASQAMADEMLEARKSANPLRIRLEQRNSEPGLFDGTLYLEGDRVVIVHRVEVLIGQGEEVRQTVRANDYGNAYLSHRGPGLLIQERFAQQPFDQATGDLLTIRVIARPQEGLEQSREFLYRIQPDRTLEDLGARTPQIS